MRSFEIEPLISTFIRLELQSLWHSIECKFNIRWSLLYRWAERPIRFWDFPLRHVEIILPGRNENVRSRFEDKHNHSIDFSIDASIIGFLFLLP